MPISNEDAEFLTLGIQYYTAGRSAAWAGLMPVCGNLCHHAVEMLLKAGLSRKHSLAELKKIRSATVCLTFGRRLRTNFPHPILHNLTALLLISMDSWTSDIPTKQ